MKESGRGSGLVVLLALLVLAMGVAAAWPDIRPYAEPLLGRLAAWALPDALTRAPQPQQPAAGRLEMIESSLALSARRQETVERHLAALEAHLQAALSRKDRDDVGTPQPTPVSTPALAPRTVRTNETSLRDPSGAEGSTAERAAPGEKRDPQTRRQADRRPSGALLLLAIRQLRDAVNRGTPFETEYQVVHALGGERFADGLPFLEPHRSVGIPTRALLTDRFAPIAGPARNTANRAAGNWLEERFGQFLASAIVIRRTDGGGDDSNAAIKRAERMLAQGDFIGGVDALKSVQGPAASILMPWLQAAMARANADRVLSEILSTAIAIASEGGD
jgi:hypothetical protein